MDDEISEVPNNPMDLADDEHLEQEQEVRRERGAPKIPDMWTRVISMSTDDLRNITLYPISEETKINLGYTKTRKRKGEPDWEIHFHPQDMIDKHPEPDLEKWSLKEERLRNYAI